MRPNAHKLLHGSEPCQHHAITHNYMPSKGSIVREDTMVAYLAVVRNMCVSHYKAVVAYFSGITVGSASVDGYTLANGGIIANYSDGIFALEFEVLRDSRDNRAREDLTIFANSRPFHYRHIGPYPGTFSYLYIFMYSGEGVNLHIRSYFCVRVDVCKRVDHFLSFLMI
jgi:hypothetical protein